MGAIVVATLMLVCSSQMNAVRVFSLLIFPFLNKLRFKGCGMDINPSGKLLDSKLCSVLACSGNSVEYCGASYSMIIYNLGVAGSD